MSYTHTQTHTHVTTELSSNVSQELQLMEMVTVNTTLSDPEVGTTVQLHPLYAN